MIETPRGNPAFTDDPAALRPTLIEDRYAERALDAASVFAVSRLVPVHRDPFDHLLVALPRAEGRRLLPTDRMLGAYRAW